MQIGSGFSPDIYSRDDEDDDDSDNETSEPSDSVASRAPLQPIQSTNASALANMSNAPSGLDEASRKKLMDTILKRQANPASYKVNAQDVANDPLMQQYLKDKTELDNARDARHEKDYGNNLIAALSPLTHITQAPTDNPVYSQIQAQNQDIQANKQKDLDTRTKVMEAIQGRLTGQAEKQQSLDQSMLSNLTSRSQTQNSKLDTMMVGVKNKMTNDPILKPASQNMESLDKSMSIVNNKSIPLTPQMLADAEQDIANALTFRGSTGATEGKIKRTEMETLQRKIAEIRQKWGSKPVDLRTENPELVDQVSKMIQGLRSDYVNTINKRTGKLVDEYSTVIGDPEAKRRLGSLKEISTLPMTPENEKSSQYSPDVIQYAQKHNISIEAAQKIKDQRMGGG